jgi:uncharacterized membrane protein
MVFTEDLPFARNTSRAIVEAKLFLLIGVFIYAYFKFTWALRQFNFLSVLLGAAPQPKTSEAELDAYTSRFGMLNALSADEFNGGIRAYYFGFAALGWFVHPGIFIVFTLAILAVLYRRDFRSRTLGVLDERA